MFSYVIKRIIYFVPTFLVIIFLCFFLLEIAPGDSVVTEMQQSGLVDNDKSRSFNYQKEYTRIAKEQNKHLPRFYFSIVPNFYPFDFYDQITFPNHKIGKSILEKTGDFAFAKSIIDYLSTNSTNDLGKFFTIQSSGSLPDLLDSGLLTEKQKHLILSSNKGMYFPKIIFHGKNSRFHSWFSDLINFQFGNSNLDGRPVTQKISKALIWTAVLGLLGLIFSCLIAIPLGVISAYYQGLKWDKWISWMSYIFYSIPLFWFATIMVVFFTTKEYGLWTNIFPSVGISNFGDQGVFSKVGSNFSRLILPVFCMIIHSIPYLIRQVRASLIESISHDYYQMAISKGVTKRAALIKHVLPNGLLPIITIISGWLPKVLGGSLIIEVIFNIPGMGRLLFQSIFNDDWNVMMGILLLVSIFTLVFYLIGDIIYARLSPQIRYD